MSNLSKTQTNTLIKAYSQYGIIAVKKQDGSYMGYDLKCKSPRTYVTEPNKSLTIDDFELSFEGTNRVDGSSSLSAKTVANNIDHTFFQFYDKAIRLSESEEVKKEIDPLVEEGLKWLEENPKPETEDLKTKLKEYQDKINPLMQKLYGSNIQMPPGVSIHPEGPDGQPMPPPQEAEEKDEELD
jgi:hypothetical protein